MIRCCVALRRASAHDPCKDAKDFKEYDEYDDPESATTVVGPQPLVLSEDSITKMNNPAEESTPVTFLYPASIKTTEHSSFPAGNTDYKAQSAVESNDESEESLSDPRQLIDEATSFASTTTINRRSHHRRTRGLRPTANAEIKTDNDTWNVVNLDINNRDVTEIPSEFGVSVNWTGTHHGKRSMVSSPPKDLPATLADSFEQKTSSETFLALDRISTQSIDKNTATANGVPGAPRSYGDAVFTAVKMGLPYFSAGDARGENDEQEHARKCVDRAQNESRQKPSKDRRESISSVGSITSVRRRSDPLQAVKRVKRLSVSVAPSALRKNNSKTNNTEHPEKNKNVRNMEKAEYKNKTIEKQAQTVQPLLPFPSPELKIKADGKGSSTDVNATVETTTLAVPASRIRFPPKVLKPMKFIPREREHKSANGTKFEFKEYLTGYFHRFYEARKQLRSIIEEKAKCERRKTHRPTLVYWKKDETSKQNATLKNETENYPSNTKPVSVSKVNNSIDSGSKTSSVSNSKTLENKILASSTETFNVSEINSIDFNGKNLSASNSPKSQEEILASTIKTSNISEINNSTNSLDRNNSPTSNSSRTNSQNEILASEEATSYLNTSSVSSQKAVRKPMQTETNTNSSVALVFAKSLNVLSKEVAQKVDEHHLEQSMQSNVEKDKNKMIRRSVLTLNHETL
ncbi:hypothetical protein X777_02941 [Ooceraea biroi]|nr:hypothetical protein X777_02941 [Ooceraea biroi]